MLKTPVSIDDTFENTFCKLLRQRKRQEGWTVFLNEIISQEKQIIRKAFQELQENLVDWGYDDAAVNLHINEILKSKRIEEIEG